MSPEFRHKTFPHSFLLQLSSLENNNLLEYYERLRERKERLVKGREQPCYIKTGRYLERDREREREQLVSANE